MLTIGKWVRAAAAQRVKQVPYQQIKTADDVLSESLGAAKRPGHAPELVDGIGNPISLAR